MVAAEPKSPLQEIEFLMPQSESECNWYFEEIA